MDESLSPSPTTTFYLETHGPLPRNHPLGDRAQAVFAETARASDLPASPSPSLVLIDTAKPLALVTESAHVVVSRGALELAASEGDGEGDRDACLAFVLGHELAHVARGDLSHARAFAELDGRAGDDEGRLEELAAHVRSPEELQEAELLADRAAVVAALMAGYDIEACLETDFLERWAASPVGEIAFAGHPEPRIRTRMARERLETVFRQASRYHQALRLEQLARPEDTLRVLGPLLAEAPSREVLTLAGLAHRQLGAEALAGCDEDLVLRFRLPVVLDPSTRLARRRSSADLMVCFQGEAGRELDRARELLEQATARDPSYGPAWLGLTSTILLGPYPEDAYGPLRELQKIAPEGSDLAAWGEMLAALTSYRHLDSPPVEEVLRTLSALEGHHPHLAALPYNRGRILAETRRKAAAREAFARFLALEPRGPWADHVATDVPDLVATRPVRLPEGTASEQPTLDPETRLVRPAPISPIPLGPMEDSTREALDSFRLLELPGDPRVREWRRHGQWVLALHDSVEIVEERLWPEEGEPALTAARVLQLHGPPLRTADTLRGRLLIYPTFAYEVVDPTGPSITDPGAIDPDAQVARSRLHFASL